MLSCVNSFGLSGIASYIVTAETDISRGLPAFDIVGLPDAAVKEARDRVRSAIKNSGLNFPDMKVVVNLAPADTRKTGSVYDLSILLSILSAGGALNCDLSKSAFLGELSLGGELRGVPGVLPMILGAAALGIDEVVIPAENAAEGAVVKDAKIYAAKNVSQVLGHLCGAEKLPLCSDFVFEEPEAVFLPDLMDVKGQTEVKRALTIAAAGLHNLLFIGPPGSGKSMLAKRLPSILPEMTYGEQVETTKIYSVSGLLPRGTGLISSRPFRAPHHTVSPAGLTGGGANPRPGEVSLAHNGVLFLDELPEYMRSATESLRQPMEDSCVTISRVLSRVTYPSRFMLVAAMNPCPCGFYGHPTKKCVCSPQTIARYLGRVSGPLLDRIDLHVEVPPVNYQSLSAPNGDSSSLILSRVTAARLRQLERFRGTNVTSNAAIPRSLLEELCPLTDEARRLLKMAFDKLGLSARGYDRILKVARTVADLESSETISAGHISEAIQYRSLDRKYWNG